MLNFRNTNIVFVILLMACILIHLAAGLPFFVYALLLIFYSLVLFYGCYFIQSNFFLPVICSANTIRKEIAISFDDGPIPGATPAILSILEEEAIKAAFFCIGKRIPGNEAIFKKIHGDGHLVGNHSYSHHFWFDLYSTKRILEDLQEMDNATSKVLGFSPRLFRPPYGVINPNVRNAIQQGGYIPVGWSVRSFDTVIKNEAKLLRKLKRQLRPGAVYLFHDTSNTTLAVLPLFIKWVKQNGYTVERLDKMLNLSSYA